MKHVIVVDSDSGQLTYSPNNFEFREGGINSETGTWKQIKNAEKHLSSAEEAINLQSKYSNWSNLRIADAEECCE